MTDASLSERLAHLTPQQRAELAGLLRERAAAARADGAGALPRIDRSSGRLPMSFAQRRLHFLQKLRPDSPAYNVVEAVRVRGPLDLDALRAALTSVVARHEVLRTKCAPEDGEPTLIVFDPAVVEAELTVEVVGLQSLAQVHDAFARHAERPFDLEGEFPLRVTLARLADDDHALLFVAHHIASDAWSCRLLLQEFFGAYTVPGDAPPPVQYADFAAWQKAHLSTDEVGADLAYWRERLAGMPPILELPLERPRPPVRSDHGAEVHVDLDGETRRRLHATARAASVTPFGLLLTAFGYVLHRHCGTADVVVGAPVSGRDRVEVEQLLGCFVNTVVLRLDFSELPSRRDLVRRVWEGTLDDLEHQGLPFEHLVAELICERDLSAGQLVQVMFNYYPATELHAPVPGLDIQPIEVDRARAKFDLTCTVVDSRDTLRVTLTYATQLLDRELVVRLGEHFVAVLGALLSDLDAPMASLVPVPPSDAARLPAGAGPASPARGDMSALSRFESQARAHPDRTAVRHRADAISYADLDQRANRLARYLGEREPGPGPVALLFDRSIDHVVAMLAALKAGLTYLPLDPAMPASHTAAVLQAAGAALLLTHAAVDRSEVAAAAPLPVDIVTLEDIDAELAAYSPLNPGRQAAADQAMYVLFTSGSTGRPKGVVVEHRHFTRYLTAVLERMEVPEQLNFAIVSTFAADLGLTNLYGALTTGGTLHVLPYDWATDPELFAAYFRRHRIDFMKLVPSHLQAIAEAGLLESVVPARYLILAGEACSWDLVDAVRSARPGCSIWNHYGPTETTVSVLAYRVPAEPPSARGGTVPLGFPLDHVQVHVVDRHLRPVPRGAAGEVLIAGDSVARGYLSPEDSGAARFVHDPFSDDPGARAYRSGDRARARSDGTLEFLGRLDRQTKIRGYRVEPSSVEAVLRRHPGVTDAVVAVAQDRNDRAALVAYHLLDPAAPERPSAASLREFARSTMPPYMVPAAFVELDRLPLTANGKLDWQALPEPGAQDLRPGPPVPPRDARDARVAEVWCDVLGLDDIGIDDDFFAAGGDSFSAMRLARGIGGGVRVVSVFQYPTVRRLVDFLGRSDTGGHLCRLPGPAGGSGTTTATVVAVPFGGGTAAAYGDLAKALPPEFPLYAVELPGHDVVEPGQPLESFDATASECLEEIRRTISGPVVVYGHCLGAALAFDIARRLEAEGGEVVGVVLGGAFPAPRLPGRLFALWARVDAE